MFVLKYAETNLVWGLQCFIFLAAEQSLCPCQDKYCYDLSDVSKPTGGEQGNKQGQHSVQDYICS